MLKEVYIRQLTVVKVGSKILFVSDQAGVGDIILDPNNSRIIYASTWEMKRNGYRMDSGGPDSKVFEVMMKERHGKIYQNLMDFLLFLGEL